MKKRLLIPVLLATLPVVSYAQPSNLNDLVNTIIRLLNPIFILIISLIVLFVLWGLASTVFSLGGEEGVRKGKTIMLWGTIALFLSVGFWGIITLVSNTFL